MKKCLICGADCPNNRLICMKGPCEKKWPDAFQEFLRSIRTDKKYWYYIDDIAVDP